MNGLSEWICVRKWELQQLEKLNYERVNIHNIELEINEYLKELGVLKNE